MSEKKETQEPSLQEVANTIYVYLRKVNCSADEHDGLKKNVEFLFSKATEAESFKTKCEDHEKTISSLSLKPIIKNKK